MDPTYLSLALNAVLAGAVVLLGFRLTAVGQRVSTLDRDEAYATGYQAGRKELLDSIRYEREVFDCRRSGVFRKETTLKIREGVFLGNLRIAQSEHEVVLTSEISQETLWTVVDRVTHSAIGPDVGNVVRRVAPAVLHLLARGGNPT